MYGNILKNLTIVKLYRGMSKLKVEVNVNLPQFQLLCIVVSVALIGEFERFGGFCAIVTVNAQPTKYFSIHFFTFRTSNQTRRLCGRPVVFSLQEFLFPVGTGQPIPTPSKKKTCPSLMGHFRLVLRLSQNNHFKRASVRKTVPMEMFSTYISVFMQIKVIYS